MTTRTDDDLECLLRATFRSEAATVAAGPAWTGAPEQRAHRRWIAPLVAAALVLALAGAFLVAHGRAHRNTPPASAGPDFTSFDVVGYPVTSRLTSADESSVIVRTKHGVRSGDAIVYRYLPGKFHRNHLEHQRRVMISGHRGYAGADGAEEFRGKIRPMHEVIWQFAPNRWAMVQQMGGLTRVPSAAALLAVARAARPDMHVAQTTPVRFTAIPAGTSFNHVEVHSGSGVIFLELYRGTHQAFQLTVGPADDPSDTGGDVTVRHDGLQLDIFSAQLHGGPSAADRRAMHFLARHVVWDTTDLRDIVP